MTTFSDRTLLSNTFYNSLGKVLPLAVGVITIPLLIHKMGTERFGTLNLFWVFIGYFGIFELGLGRATTKFTADYMARNQQDDLPHLIWTSICLLFLLGLVASTVALFLVPFITQRVLNISPPLMVETQKAFSVACLSLPFVFSTSGIQGVLEAQQRFALINTIRVPASIANFLAPLPIFLFTASLYPIVTMTVFLRVLVWMALLYYCLKSLPGLSRPRFPTLGRTRQLLSFGGWLTVTNLVGPIMSYFDRFFIGAFLTMEAVAYYATPFDLVNRLGIIPGSLMPVLFPAFSTYSADRRDELASLHNRAVKYLFLILAPLAACLLVLAHPFLSLWLGAEFAAVSSPILQLLALGVLVNSLAFVPYSALQAIGRPDLTAKLHFLELPFYLASIWLLIKTLGLVGVALAWVLRVVIDAGLLFWLAHRILPLKRLEFHNLKPGLIICAVVACAGLCGALAASNLIQRIILLSAILASFAIMAWGYILDDKEKAQILLAKGALFQMRPPL
jgi:O-antigen/teichoic acid export membrane protein